MDSTGSFNNSLYSTPVRGSKCDRLEKSSYQSTNENSNPAHSPSQYDPLSLPSISTQSFIQTSWQPLMLPNKPFSRVWDTHKRIQP
jgi:hypothetical protein